MKTPPTSGRILSIFILLAIPCSVSLAQAVTPITSSGLNTTVSAPITLPSGQTQFDITGGTRPGGGTNLFHSFGDFNVPNNNIANFLNDSGLATSNILGRVTGGNISNIFGTIQTTGFGNANLFLMNPAGFLFGPNATVNVGGMMTFTSADYLRLADGARFNAISHTAPDLLLSAAPVAAFGFLGSNPGAITVQGSQLSVAEGTGISLVGGNITVQAGTLTAPSGQINLVSVGKPSNPNVGGEVANGGEFSATGFNSLGVIQLASGSSINTSSNAAGPVFIRAGQLIMGSSSSINAGTVDAKGGNVEIDVQTLQMAGTAGPTSPPFFTFGAFISTTSFGAGQGGDIHVNATRSVTITDNHTEQGFFTAPLTGLLSEATKTGNSGNIFVSTPLLSINGPAGGISTQTFSIQPGGGHAGSITLEVGTLRLNGGAQMLSDSLGLSTGSAGNISVHASDLVDVNGSGGPVPGTFSRINSGSFGFGNAGNILILSPRLTINHGTIRAQSGQQASANAGSIDINVGTLNITNGEGILTTSVGSGGDIVINASRSVEISGSRGISSQAFGSGKAGNISITTPMLSIDGGGGCGNCGVPSGIDASTSSKGDAGNIVLNINKLTMENGGQINSSTENGGLAGHAGTITLQGSAGQGSSAKTVVLDNSAIRTTTVAQNPTNAPASIEIKAHTVVLNNAAQITANTSDVAPAGSITLNVGNLTATNGAQISSSSTSMGSNAGSAGQVTIQGLAGPGSPATHVRLDNSKISATSVASDGGTIHVEAHKVRLTDSQLTTAVSGGPQTVGGTITLDAKNVKLENSEILSTATEGHGGTIGISTHKLHSTNSVIDGTSQFGTDGTVTVKRP